MRVLSLFDGISCGYVALERAGIPIEEYYASEIDKHAIKVALKNHPDIIEIGDVCQVKGEDYQGVDLVIGWSPCTGFSLAWKQLNFDDPQSKLFFEFVRIVNEAKPKYFLLENVKMKKEYSDKITEMLWWIAYTQIDSSLVSAQRRVRNYRVGKLQEDGTYTKVEIAQPEDEGVLLKDIFLPEEQTKDLILTPERIEMIRNWKCYEKPLERVKTWEDKMDTLTTHCGKWSWWIRLVDSGSWIRMLHPVECERLQTLPDEYTKAIPNSFRYKALWNWWTCSIIAHIFRNLFW